jgi:hypothetical protein
LPKVCLDSNVWVSGLVYGRQPGKIVEMALIGTAGRRGSSNGHLSDAGDEEIFEVGHYKMPRIIKPKHLLALPPE